MKTLFFSISSSAVYRNLFFFPGSLFDELGRVLRERDDLRVVMLLPPQFRDKYGSLVSPQDLGDKIVVRVVETSTKKNLLQHAFYFLYSYLIFTGTTKIMATMGTRPDEPPAGGRWYMAPVKRLIASTLGRVRLLKRDVVPYLWLRIFRERPFAELFEEYHPDAVFAPHIYGWFDTLLIAEAKRHGIAVIAMPAGWDHLDKYFLPFHASRLLVQSEQVRRMALVHQAYDVSRTIITGYPHFDFIAKKEYSVSREETLARLGFPEGARYILYVSGSAYCPDEPEIIEKILAWADEGRFGAHDVRLVIRPYQGGRGKDREFDEQKFNRFAEHPRVVFYRREFWGDLDSSVYFMNILCYADIVLSIYSTMIVEAAVLDRPLMTIAFDGSHHRPYHRSLRRFEEFDHFQEVLAHGAVRIARNFADLHEGIRAYLDNPGLDRENRERLRREVCGPLDGEASKRVRDVLIGSLPTS